MYAIKAENLSKVYKKQVEQRSTSLFSFRKKQEDFYALKDINFEITKGETVGIIGGNGAGKSTLLKILSGITYPSSGKVTIDGRVTSLLEVGTGFHPELTGRENVYLNGSLLGMNKLEINTKFDEIVDFSGIESFIDTPVKKYSSGMYVRLAFAIAAHLQTEIILLDEVFAVGDAQFQRKCLDKLEQMKMEGRTIIIVSHNISEIIKNSTSGILLNKGEIIKIGTIENVSNYYLHTNTKFSLNNEKGAIKNASIVHQSNEFKIIVDYETRNMLSLPNLGFLIFNNNFQPITGTNLLFENKHKILSNQYSNKGRIEGVIDYLPLANGVYIVSLSFSDGPQVIEKLLYCLKFEVVDSRVIIEDTGSISLEAKFTIMH
jgi:lipopolysaccharide transport system ATP-binding protein